MRIVVTGATGNLGSSVVAGLAADRSVDAIDALGRRAPSDPGALGRALDCLRLLGRGVFAGTEGSPG